MEKIYPYADMIFLGLVLIFLIFTFYRLIGKKVGIQRSDHFEAANMSTDIKGVIKHTNSKDNTQNNIDVFAEGSLNAKLEKVKKLDNKFNYKDFISYCKDSFSKIVVNFNKGNLEEIKDLLSPNMYESFKNYVQENIINNKVEINRFLLVDVIDVDFEKELITIKVKFVTKQNINEELSEMREIWYFIKNHKLENDSWHLTKVVND